MEIKFFALLLVLRIFFCTCSVAQMPFKDTLYIESVDLNILTFSSISCGDFATNFRDRIKFRTIIDTDTMKLLSSFLGKARYSKKDRDVDVRAKFIYEKEDKSKTIICTNGYEILVDNRLIRRNSRFADFLRNLVLPKLF